MQISDRVFSSVQKFNLLPVINIIESEIGWSLIRRSIKGNCSFSEEDGYREFLLHRDNHVDIAIDRHLKEITVDSPGRRVTTTLDNKQRATAMLM